MKRSLAKALCALGCLLPLAVAAGHIISDVAPGGAHTSLQLNAGKPVIAYVDPGGQHLMLATCTAGCLTATPTWVVTTVTALSGLNGTSLALNGGNPVIAYSDGGIGPGPRVLKLATCTANCATAAPTWVFTTVGPTGTQTTVPFLELNGGNPVIAYIVDIRGPVRLATCTANCASAAPTWVFNDVWPSNANIAPMRLVGGNPVVAITDGSNDGPPFAAILATCTAACATASPVWNYSTLSGNAAPVALAMNGSIPVVALQAVDGSGHFNLVTCATNCGTAAATWITAPVGTPAATGGYHSMQLVGGNPVISFDDPFPDDLKVAVCTAGCATVAPTWKVFTVESAGQVGWYTSLQIQAGVPVVSYLNLALGLRLAVVDTSIPAVASIAKASADPVAAGGSVDFTVTFSEAVSGVGASDFSLATSGLSGASITGVSGGGTTWTVTANAGSGLGTLRLDVLDDDSITDGSNPLGGAGAGNGAATGPTYTVADLTPPTVISIVRTGASPVNQATPVAFTVTFSESVVGVDAGDFFLSTTGLSGATVTGVSGSGATWTVTANPGAGLGTIRLDLADDDSITDGSNPLGGAGAGNGSFSAGQSYSIADLVPPAVVSIVRAAASPTAAPSVAFTVTFSEPVAGVDASDFVLATAGLSGAAVAGVAGSAAVWTVTASTGGGGGTLRLDLVDDDSITDASGNALGGPGSGNGTFTTGETYAKVLGNTFTGPAPNGSGTITASFTGGGPGCTFLPTPAFIAAVGAPLSPPTVPAGVSFPQGLFDFRLGSCTPGSTVTMTITYPRSLAFGARYWKYGPTAADTQPHWYLLGGLVDALTATFDLTDGGLGDDDLAADGTIVDQGGPGIAGAAVPTIGNAALAALALLMFLMATLRRTPSATPRRRSLHPQHRLHRASRTWSSQSMKSEAAGVSVQCGPPLKRMNSWPRPGR